jgi:hypothetical protein
MLTVLQILNSFGVANGDWKVFDSKIKGERIGPFDDAVIVIAINIIIISSQ